MGSFYIGGFVIGQKIAELEAAIAGSSAVEVGSRLDDLEAWSSDRVKYIYPNGGSVAIPMGLSLGAVYMENSPFEIGVKFSAYTEYFSENAGEWVVHQIGIYINSRGGVGCSAFPRSESGIVVVVTGSNALGDSPGAMAGWEGESLGYKNASKWRVRCVRED